MLERLLNLVLLNLGLMFSIVALYWGFVMFKKDIANYRKRWAEAAVRKEMEREREAERREEMKAEREQRAIEREAKRKEEEAFRHHRGWPADRS